MTYTTQVAYGIQTFQDPWNLTYPDASTLRFELRPDEQFPTPVANLVPPQDVQRAEINLDQIYGPGTPISIAYDFTLQSGISQNDWVTIGQMHSESEGLPPFMFWLQPDNHLTVSAAYGNGNIRNPRMDLFTDPNPLVQGHTYHIQVDMNLSNDSTGYLHVWRDGVEIVDYNGPIGYNDNTYWKMGLYRAYDPAHSADLVVDYSNFSITVPAGDGVGVDPPSPTGVEVLPPNPTGSMAGVYLVDTTDNGIPSDTGGTDTGTGTSAGGTDTGTGTGGTGTGTSAGGTGTGTGAGDTVPPPTTNPPPPPAPGENVVFGSRGDDHLTGGDGNDKLYGGRGNDVLVGHSGNDVLWAGSGQDILMGGQGNDRINGESGNDYLLLDGTMQDYTLGITKRGTTLTNSVGEVDTFNGVEVLHFSDGTNYLIQSGKLVQTSDPNINQFLADAGVDQSYFNPVATVATQQQLVQLAAPASSDPGTGAAGPIGPQQASSNSSTIADNADREMAATSTPQHNDVPLAGLGGHALSQTVQTKGLEKLLDNAALWNAVDAASNTPTHADKALADLKQQLPDTFEHNGANDTVHDLAALLHLTHHE